MSCYINEPEVFAVIRNTILDILRWKNNENCHESYNFFDATNKVFKNKLIEDELNSQLLKCYKAQVKSYNEHYRENEKVEKNFIEYLKSIKVSYYLNKHHKVMLLKSINCMLYQIEVKFNYKFWDTITDSLLKDMVYKSKEYENATWGYGDMEEKFAPKINRLFLSYMDPESDDDKFGIMANSSKKVELVNHIAEDLNIHYCEGEADKEIEEFLKEVLNSQEEEHIFEFNGRKHYYKITEEVVAKCTL